MPRSDRPATVSRHGVAHYSTLPNSATVTTETLYKELQEVKVKAAALFQKLANPWLLWDNACPHKARDTQAVLDRQGIRTVTHPPYSPDITPCDFRIFRSIQNFLDGKQLKNERDLEDVIEDWAEPRPAGFWEDGVASLPDRWRKVVGMHGGYIMD
uniref:DDE_3 domain-containing protein n=1 Tax=Haemonchus contortus TaxID=6289 RepID=A0A7I4Z537_HAECO